MDYMNTLRLQLIEYTDTLANEDIENGVIELISKKNSRCIISISVHILNNNYFNLECNIQ